MALGYNPQCPQQEQGRGKERPQDRGDLHGTADHPIVWHSGKD